jgi:high-affinity nickel permease
MQLPAALLLGVALGLRHAVDPDHLAAIAALSERRPARAARTAALWGMGHSVTFLVIGFTLVLLGLRLPAAFERVAQLICGGTLVIVGVVRWRPRERIRGSLSPVWVGLAHGLSGSAGIALLALSAVGTRLAAVAYLILFAAGTVLGMVLVTMLLAWPMALGSPRLSWSEGLRRLGCLASAGLGLLLLLRALLGG